MHFYACPVRANVVFYFEWRLCVGCAGLTQCLGCLHPYLIASPLTASPAKYSRNPEDFLMSEDKVTARAETSLANGVEEVPGLRGEVKNLILRRKKGEIEVVE